MADEWSDKFRYHMAKDMDLSSNTFALALFYSALSTDWSTGVSYLSQLSAFQASGSGYSAGGNQLDAVTWTQSGATVDFDCSEIVFTGCTLSTRYAAIYNVSVDNRLVGKWDLGSNKTPDDGTLTITPDSVGLFTLS